MFLMLKNKEVLELNNDFELVKIINTSLLPYALGLVPYLSITTASIRIQNWLTSRLLPMSRTHYKQLMLSVGVNQSNDVQKKLEIVKFCHGVKINDSYWLKLTENDDYKDYNIYKHTMNQESIDVALNGEIKHLTVEDLLCDLTTDGTFPKAWVRKDGELHLLKTAYPDKNVTIMDFINSEVNSSKTACIYKHIDVVDYNIFMYDTVPCTICKCFTNEDIMFIPYDDCGIKYESLDDFIKPFRYYLIDMFTSDIKVKQIDRHGGNFGVLVDANTNEVIGFAPLFDYNLSGTVAEKLMMHPETAYCEPFKMSMQDALKYLLP